MFNLCPLIAKINTLNFLIMMQVILTQDVPKLGRKDEAVKVRDGYAVNFLLPNEMAVCASPKRLEAAKKRLDEVLIQKERITEKAEEIKKMVDELKQISVAKRVGEKDTLYASVSEKDVIEKVEEAINVRLEAKNVHFPEVLKKLGTGNVVLRLAEGVTADLEVNVVAQ